MTATYSKVLLSGSTDGLGIKIMATGTPGTTIHTADATALDEIWVYLFNSQLIAVKTTVEWGTTTAPDGNIEVTIQGESGLVLVIPGLLLTNSSVVSVFGSYAGVVMAHGFVNRITP